MRYLLFDIDGTLMQTGGCGQKALAKALRFAFDVDDPNVNLSFAGKTDCWLFPELLRRNKLRVDELSVKRLKKAYLEHFGQELRGAVHGRVLSGVVELLNSLDSSGSCHLSVMTGNLRETATRKLEHYGLNGYMQFIIGGDRDADRNDLAKRALRHIRQHDATVDPRDIVVIGDTPADVHCGKAIGCQTVAVATGQHSTEDLIAAEPDHVFQDLNETETVHRTLLR